MARRTHEFFSSKAWSRAVLPFLIIRAMLGLVGVAVTYYLMPLMDPNSRVRPVAPWMNDFPGMLWRMWGQFDGYWYLRVASSGYDAAESLRAGVQSNWAFFPLYPLLMRLVSIPLGGGQDSLRLAGVAIAAVGAVTAAVFLYKLTVLELGDSAASRAVLYFGLYPTGFYLWAIYPESVFIALAIACFYYARRRRWVVAGLLGGLAVLARPPGLALFPILGWEYWQCVADRWAPISEGTGGIVSRSRDWMSSRITGGIRSLRAPSTWTGALPLLAIPGALVGFLIYSKITVGTYWAFFRAEHYGWGRQPTNPIATVLESIWPPRPPSPDDWNGYGLNVLTFVAFLLILAVVVRCLPSVYAVAAALFMVTPLTSGDMLALSREYLMVFPGFMALAWLMGHGDAEAIARRHSLVTACMAVLLCLGMTMFILSVRLVV